MDKPEVKQYDPPITFMEAEDYVPLLFKSVSKAIKEFESKFPVTIKKMVYKNGKLTIEAGRLQLSLEI